MDDWKNIDILSLDECLTILNEVLKQRGMNLSPAMRAAASAAWDGRSYEAYIKNHDLTFTELTLRKRGSLLFKELVQAFGVEKIAKHNLKTILQKLYVDGRLSGYTHVINKQLSKEIAPSRNSNFVGRHKELADLVGLFKRNQCLNIWGSPGVGKTTLIREFLERQQQDYKTCWMNISPEITFESWIKETLILMGDRASTDPREQLFDRLFRQKWALVLDHADSSKVYRDFLISLSNGDCASKFFFVSTRRLNEFGAIPLSSCYQIQGLEEYELLFRKLGLKKQSRWSELAEKYNSNPRELIHVAQVIRQFFNGCIANYLDNSSTVFSKHARRRVERSQFSEVELQILDCVNRNSGIKSGELFNLLKKNLSSGQIIENLTALEEQTFIEKTQNGFIVSPLIRKIIRSEKTVELC